MSDLQLSGATVTGLPALDLVRCHRAIRYARDAAHANGNQGADQRLSLLTGDLATYNRYRPLGVAPVQPGQYAGLYGRHLHGPCIWIDPTRTATQQARTLAHELAHMHTANRHGHLWRRLYAMLVGPVSDILGTPVHTGYAISRCAELYYHPEKSPAAREAIRLGGIYRTRTLDSLRTREIWRLTRSAEAGELHYSKWMAVERRHAPDLQN